MGFNSSTKFCVYVSISMKTKQNKTKQNKTKPPLTMKYGLFRSGILTVVYPNRRHNLPGDTLQNVFTFISIFEIHI